MKTARPQNLARARAAGTPLALESFTVLAFEGIKVTTRPELPAASERTGARAILLVSEDGALGDDLCLVAAQNALPVVRTSSLREALEQANRVQPGAILLDLDLPSDAGWQAAERFLGQGPGAPILMLTGRVADHELGAAIRSGTVFDKANGSARILHAAVSMLEEPAQQAQGRMALLQAWLRRAKPYRWEAEAAPGCRHWGINE